MVKLRAYEKHLPTSLSKVHKAIVDHLGYTLAEGMPSENGAPPVFYNSNYIVVLGIERDPPTEDYKTSVLIMGEKEEEIRTIVKSIEEACGLESKVEQS
jgi:hypothetical protein